MPSWETADGGRQIITLIGGFPPFGRRQPFCIGVHRFAGIGFVAFGLPFEFFLNAAFYLGQVFHSVFCLFEAVAGAGLGSLSRAALSARREGRVFLCMFML